MSYQKADSNGASVGKWASRLAPMGSVAGREWAWWQDQIGLAIKLSAVGVGTPHELWSRSAHSGQQPEPNELAKEAQCGCWVEMRLA